MKFMRSSSTAQSWAPEGVPVPPVLSHWATVASAAVPVSVRSAGGKLSRRERRNVAAEVERLGGGDQPHDRLRERHVPGLVEHRCRARRSGRRGRGGRLRREVANDVVLDQLLERVADGRVQRARDGRLQTPLLVRDGQHVRLEDQGGPVRRPEQAPDRSPECCERGGCVRVGARGPRTGARSAPIPPECPLVARASINAVKIGASSEKTRTLPAAICADTSPVTPSTTLRRGGRA